MTAPSPQRIRALFDAALALPEAERAAFLTDECHGDAVLQNAVTRLLQASRASGGFLASATLSQEGEPLTEASGLQTGDHIGPYEIIGELGCGGGGVVYLARQQSPVDREVALKMLSSTADSLQTVQRFRSEQRTLAKMEHDHIAKLYDAGVDLRGRLWFAMELVRGEPVTTFCDHHQLALPARLRLFAAICRAVHHAHLRGVIHRDLKPSNLLVAGNASHPVPKVIDFGIARALENAEDAGLTLAGGLIGTPAYMSPEQFGDGTGEIDARTDLYSLGLVLFELLSGLKARHAPASASAALHAARWILEETPPSPAGLFAVLPAERQSGIATARRTDPAGLRRELRGDAGRIIARCLSRDPAGRFPSAESLASDIDHLLAHRPLSFQKPGWLYPTAKFLRRHRTGAIATALAALTAATGLGIGLHAHFARLKAEAHAHAETTRAAQETDRAARESRKGYLITLAMTSLFRSATPEFGHHPDRTVRHVVDAWTEKLPSAVQEDREVEGLARLSLGNAWNGFGDPIQARTQFQSAAALLSEPSSAFSPARALTELNLASLDLQEHHYETAEHHLLLARRYFTTGGGTYISDLLRIELLLAGQRTDTGQPSAATAIARRVLSEAKTKLPDDLELQARAHWQLSRAARTAGDQASWDQHLRRRLELVSQAKGMIPAVILEARFDVLRADYLAGKNPPETLLALDQLLSEYRARTGPNHQTYLAFRADVAALLAQTGDPAAATSRYEALIRDAPDSPVRSHWEESLQALR